MLYDILPPLLFSFGGIIVLIARSMVKMRAHEVSEEIQAHVLSDVPVHAESVIGPNKGNVFIVKNRLFHTLSILRSTGASAIPAIKNGLASYKASIAAKKEQKAIAATSQEKETKDAQEVKPVVKTGIKSVMKGIQLPEVSIREKFEALTEKGKQGFSSLQTAITSRTPGVKQGIQTMRDQIVASIPVRKQSEHQAMPSPIIRLVHQEPVMQPKRELFRK